MLKRLNLVLEYKGNVTPSSAWTKPIAVLAMLNEGYVRGCTHASVYFEAYTPCTVSSNRQQGP